MDGSEPKAKLVDPANPYGVSSDARKRIIAMETAIDVAAGVPLGSNGQAVSGRGAAQRIAYFNRLISGPDGPVGE